MPDDQINVAASSLEDLKRLGSIYREAPQRLRSKINKALKSVSLPMVTEIPKEASRDMPRRGGLAARVADATGTVVPSLRGGNPQVALRFAGPKGKPLSLRFLEAGSVRHPVYGDRSRWTVTLVPPDQFRAAFDKQAPAASKAVSGAMQDTLNEISSMIGEQS